MTAPNRRWLGRLLLAVSLLKWTPLHAQDIELGGNAAFADVAVEAGTEPPTPDLNQRVASAGVGVEACARCSGRFGLFAEYSHWARLEPLRSATRGVTGMDIVGGGLRVQAPTLGGFRSFVDVGLGSGRRELLQSGENKVYGFIAGYGVIIPISDRWYVRPQTRGYFMADKICLCPFLLGDSRGLIFLSAGIGVGVGL